MGDTLILIISIDQKLLDKLLSAIFEIFIVLSLSQKKINNLWLRRKNILTNKTTQLDQNLSQTRFLRFTVWYWQHVLL